MKKFLATICIGLAAAAFAAEQKPNILFIAIDDMNDWIGPLGRHPQAITPNLDRLAKMGVTFRNAHTASPTCHSSRVAIMTGVRPSTSGMTANVFQGIGPNWRKNKTLIIHLTARQLPRENFPLIYGIINLKVICMIGQNSVQTLNSLDSLILFW